MSEREAARLGGPTKRPPTVLEPWTNPRTGQTMAVDRGLDPSWAGNPGKDRPRMLAEMLARGIDDLGELSAALAREAIRQVVDSPLLERQLSGRGGTGDLTVGYLDKEWREALGTPSRVVRMTPRAGEHLGEGHPEVAAGRYREVIPPLLGDPDLVYAEPARDGSDGTDLVFVRQFEDGRLWRLPTRNARGETQVDFTSVHRVQPRNIRAARDRGEPEDRERRAKLRDRRGWWESE